MLARINSRKFDTEIVPAFQSYFSNKFGAESIETINAVRQLTAEAKKFFNSANFDSIVNAISNEIIANA